MRQEKPKTSISRLQTDEEANSVLELLRNIPESASQIGRELNMRYTAAPRQKIMRRIAKIAGLKKVPLKKGVLSEFADSQWEGVTSVSMVKQIQAVLILLSAESTQSAAKQFCQLAGSGKKPGRGRVPTVDGSIIRSVAEGLNSPGQLGGLLDESLVYAGEKGMVDRLFLENWYNALLPAVGPRGMKNAINGDHASRILRNLSLSSPADVPDELILALPGLIVPASAEVVAAFYNTNLGQMVSRQVPGAGRPPAKAGHRPLPHPYGEAHRPEQADILHELERFFEKTNLMVRGLEKQVQDMGGMMIEKDRMCQSLDMDVQSLRRENEELARQNAELSGKNSEIGQELEVLRKREAVLTREIRLGDHEMGTRLRLMEDEQKENMRRLFSMAARNLKEHVQALLEENAGSSRISMLGVAFDTLHAKLLRAMGEPANLRIPPDLLGI